MKMNRKEKLEMFQRRKIKKHLDYVTGKSKYYSGYKGKKLEDFPVIVAIDSRGNNLYRAMP